MHRLDGTKVFVVVAHLKSGLEPTLPHAPVLEFGLVIIILKSVLCRGSEVKGQW